MKIRLGLVAVCLFVAAGYGVRAQAPGPGQEEFIKTHYAKYEYRIPMRDGVKLFGRCIRRRRGVQGYGAVSVFDDADAV